MISCTKDIQWYNRRMKDIFSGPQHWDYFESGMSSVKVHKSRATAKHIDIGTVFSLQTIDTREHYDHTTSGKRQTPHSHGISDSNIFQAFLDEYLQLDEKRKKSSS